MTIYDEWKSRVYPDRQQLRKKLDHIAVGKKIVFTNGCFDIIHIGHLDYLFRARQLGDILVVALNSDDSVKKLKGPERPINSEQERGLILAGLTCVDFVTFFSEVNPINTLKILEPAIHVKGGDYQIDKLPETATVQSYGGEVVILPFVNGYSSSEKINRIRNLS